MNQTIEQDVLNWYTERTTGAINWHGKYDTDTVLRTFRSESSTYAMKRAAARSPDEAPRCGPTPAAAGQPPSGRRRGGPASRRLRRRRRPGPSTARELALELHPRKGRERSERGLTCSVLRVEICCELRVGQGRNGKRRYHKKKKDGIEQNSWEIIQRD